MTIRKTTLLAVALLAALSHLCPAAGPLEPNDRVVVCGDSITEQKLYSVFIEDYLLMCQPAAGLSVAQTGWSGEVAAAFVHRIASDVLPLQPTVVTTCYGMNDGAYAAFDQTRADAYRDNQRASIKALKAGGVRAIVLGSAGAVDTTAFGRAGGTTAAVYNDTLAKFAEIDKQVAREEGVIFADVHAPMMDVMTRAKAKYGPGYSLGGTDGIHPQSNGHLVMAYAYLKALGCDGDIGTITFDMATGTAQATPGHKILAANSGLIILESTKYPFCFYGDPKSPDATTGVLEFLPFQQELNRYMLVVQHPAGKIKVTWGTTSKEFEAAEAAKGINLAAEFLDNPFSAPFQAVEARIKAQQIFETPLNKQLLHSLPAYEAYPETREAVAALRLALVAYDKKLQADALAAIVPVTHSIKIEVAK